MALQEELFTTYYDPIGISTVRQIDSSWTYLPADGSGAVVGTGAYVTRVVFGPISYSGDLEVDYTVMLTNATGSIDSWGIQPEGTTIEVNDFISKFEIVATKLSGSAGEVSVNYIALYGYQSSQQLYHKGPFGYSNAQPKELSYHYQFPPYTYVTWAAGSGYYQSSNYVGNIQITLTFEYSDGTSASYNDARTWGQNTVRVGKYVRSVDVTVSGTISQGSRTIQSIQIYGFIKEEKPMPVTGAQIQFKSGTSAGFAQITPDASTFYYLTDTQQIFLGSSEYTKSTHVLNAAPTESTPGDIGSLYAYNGNLYLCSAIDSGVYTYVRVANVNDVVGSVTSVGAGAGLATASGDDNPITSTGTIVHAVPTGASTHSSTASATQTLDFGDTFELETVDTDEFGHVTGFHTTTVTMPANPDTDTTYSISSDSEGTITLTPSEGSAETITIDGWSDLAKKSELSAVFKFKGTVATVAALPTDGEVGDVWHVTAANAEYVCVQAGTTDPQVDAVWEELGTDIDLSGYVEKVTGATAGNVANLAADGSIVDSGFTLGCSVPSTAVFTDTTYDNATTAVAGLMSTEDKIKLDAIEAGADVNVIESISVASTAIAPDSNKNVNIELSDFGLTVDETDLNQLDGKLSTTSDVLTVDGDITGNAATANFANSASTATYDANGDQIDTTYAKLTDLQWQAF